MGRRLQVQGTGLEKFLCSFNIPHIHAWIEGLQAVLDTTAVEISIPISYTLITLTTAPFSFLSFNKENISRYPSIPPYANRITTGMARPPSFPFSTRGRPTCLIDRLQKKCKQLSPKLYKSIHEDNRTIFSEPGIPSCTDLEGTAAHGVPTKSQRLVRRIEKTT